MEALEHWKLIKQQKRRTSESGPENENIKFNYSESSVGRATSGNPFIRRTLHFDAFLNSIQLSIEIHRFERAFPST